MQALFLWDANNAMDLDLGRTAMLGQDPEAGPLPDAVNAAVAMAVGAWENRAEADKWVLRLAPQWPTRRQPGVDRNVLRLAVWEMTHTQTPPKVVIDEALELVKRYSTEHSTSFVNGVLDAVYREIRDLKKEVAVTELPAAPEAKPGAGSRSPEGEQEML